MTRKIDPGLIPPSPNLQFERALWKAHLTAVAGIDEAGRGCLAGPVAAAAVILPDKEEIINIMSGIRDSKQLTAEEREKARIIVERSSLAWAVGFADNKEIDQHGIVPATRLAVWRALDKLTSPPEHLLVDYLVLPDIPLPQTRLVKGDARSLSIAAASILAKTHRDALMIASASIYPGYGFEKIRDTAQFTIETPFGPWVLAPCTGQVSHRCVVRLIDLLVISDQYQIRVGKDSESK